MNSRGGFEEEEGRGDGVRAGTRLEGTFGTRIGPRVEPGGSDFETDAGAESDAESGADSDWDSGSADGFDRPTIAAQPFPKQISFGASGPDSGVRGSAKATLPPWSEQAQGVDA